MENIQDGVDSALKVSQTQFSRQWFTFSVSRREGGGVEVAGSDEIDVKYTLLLLSYQRPFS